MKGFTLREDTLRKAHCIQQLAQRGSTDSERDTAQRLLDEFMRNHSIALEDLGTVKPTKKSYAVSHKLAIALIGFKNRIIGLKMRYLFVNHQEEYAQILADVERALDVAIERAGRLKISAKRKHAETKVRDMQNQRLRWL